METSVSVPLGPSALLKNANIYPPHSRLVTLEARNRRTSQGHPVTVLDGYTIRATPEFPSELYHTIPGRKPAAGREGRLLVCQRRAYRHRHVCVASPS